MGNIIYNNGILLDERELGTLSLDRDDLAQAIHDFLLATWSTGDDYDDGPSLEIFGCAVERLDTSFSFEGSFPKASWIREGRTFRATFRHALQGVDLPDLDVVVREDHAAILALRSDLQRSARDCIAADSYGEAAGILRALREIDGQGLPGISPGWCLSDDCDGGIFDFRERTGVLGTRILAEIGYNWGQG
jgi:hypothetical protein